MELELTAPADSVAGLGRLKVLAANRDGRPRTQSIKIVWHDSPEHALLADGQSLAEQRGAWRLERMVPGDETWLPGQPPPLLSDAPDLSVLPSPLAPLAAFDGRRTASVHRFGDESVTLTIERGTLRAVTAECPVARILLSGEAAAVHSAALLIADAIPAAVPLASLAAEAIALATGRAAPLRHRGAPALPETLADVPAALAHIIGHLTDVILAYAPRVATLDATGSEAVHQMRVAVRRARSAISIFRPAVEPGLLNTINDRLRALGRQLGPSRDWDVFADETIPAIQEAMGGDQRVERLAAAAVRRRREHRAELTAYLASTEFRKLGIELAWFAAAGLSHAAGEEVSASLAEFSATVLQHRCKRLLSAGKHMEDLDIPGLHGVRLRAKRARYAAEMFATLYRGKAAGRFIRRLGTLQQRLGVLNDGAVAMYLLEELGGPGGRHAYAAGAVAGFLAARAGKIRPRIMLAFEKFRRQPAYWA
jgi:CHAD domain-containing protein